MKKLAVLLVVAAGLMSACAVYEEPNRYGGERRLERDHDRDGRPDRVDRDRDGDGVPNRQDRRPDDSRRN
jgi:hypothetical protein